MKSLLKQFKALFGGKNKKDNDHQEKKVVAQPVKENPEVVIQLANVQHDLNQSEETMADHSESEKNDSAMEHTNEEKNEEESSQNPYNPDAFSELPLSHISALNGNDKLSTVVESRESLGSYLPPSSVTETNDHSSVNEFEENSNDELALPPELAGEPGPSRLSVNINSRHSSISIPKRIGDSHLYEIERKEK